MGPFGPTSGRAPESTKTVAGLAGRGGRPDCTGWDGRALGVGMFCPIPLAPTLRQNPRMNEQEVLYAMLRIQHALERSPSAADTVQGIHAWWVEWPEPAPHWDVTEAALGRLESEGVVERVAVEGGREIWRRARTG